LVCKDTSEASSKIQKANKINEKGVKQILITSLSNFNKTYKS
jgi:hypothetical protein